MVRNWYVQANAIGTHAIWLNDDAAAQNFKLNIRQKGLGANLTALNFPLDAAKLASTKPTKQSKSKLNNYTNEKQQQQQQQIKLQAMQDAPPLQLYPASDKFLMWNQRKAAKYL